MENNEQNNQRFLTLLSLGKTLSTIGWIIVAVSGLLIILSLGSCSDGDKLEGTIMFIIGFLSAGIGYLIVANGQMISCFVSIENNTHKTSNLLDKLIGTINKQESS